MLRVPFLRRGRDQLLEKLPRRLRMPLPAASQCWQGGVGRVLNENLEPRRRQPSDSVDSYSSSAFAVGRVRWSRQPNVRGISASRQRSCKCSRLDSSRASEESGRAPLANRHMRATTVVRGAQESTAESSLQQTPARRRASRLRSWPVAVEPIGSRHHQPSRSLACALRVEGRRNRPPD
jgi:hypothetical protein